MMRRGLLLLILLVAGVLRFYHLTAVEHNVDHAYPVWQALRTLDAGELFLVGQWTWLPVPHPALTGYVYVPALALTRSIVAVYGLVAALNTLAVYLGYRATRALAGETAALLAAWLLAVNPWLIEYSRYAWPPALVPFLVMLLAALLWPGLTTARRPGWCLGGGLVVLALLLQTTLIAWLVLLPVGALLLIFRRRVPRPALLAGGAALLLTLGLYAAGLWQQSAQVAARWDTFRQTTAAPAQLKPEALLHAARFVTGSDYDRARGVQPPIAPEDVQRRQALTGGLAVPVLSLALLTGLLVALAALFRRGPGVRPAGRGGAVILLLWFGLPALALAYNASLVHPYYLLVTVPAGAALAGAGLAALLNSAARPAGLALALLCVPAGLLLALNSVRYAEESARTPGAHGLGALPVAEGLRLGAALRAHLPPGGVVFADVDAWTLNSFAAQLFPVVRRLPAAAAMLYPAAGSLLVTDCPPGCPAPEPLNGLLRLETLTLADGTRLHLDTFQPDAPLHRPEVAYPVAGEQALALTGYTLAQSGAAVTLDTFWQVTGDPAPLAAFTF
ncbi:MAG: hypothetical protein MUE40_17220, partial [Anaerolineae bacterium]|nr:hypothetical protein [Anaerolineae bacterium]